MQRKKSFIVKSLWKILDLLRVFTMVMGISNPQEGYNLRQIPNFISLIWRDYIWYF